MTRSNQSRQPMPGSHLCVERAALARHGCVLRSTMEMTPTRSNVAPWGLACDFAASSASSVPERENTMEGDRSAWRVADCASGLRDFRALRGEAGHAPSNHSVHRTAAGYSPSGAGFAADAHTSSRGGR